MHFGYWPGLTSSRLDAIIPHRRRVLSLDMPVYIAHCSYSSLAPLDSPRIDWTGGRYGTAVAIYMYYLNFLPFQLSVTATATSRLHLRSKPLFCFTTSSLTNNDLLLILQSN
jgi:hypothetical protein